MNPVPDFSAHGFQIIRELGRNPGGGRVTYLAQTTQNNPVVLKQFQFAKGGGWAGFKAIDRETQVLQDLKHPGIPRYLGSFETEDGFCLLQEYKDAQPLSTTRSFSPDEIKHIAVSLLEILVYLQDRIPPVFHRDIKPENVLVDPQLRVYLIDFGFARIGGDNLAMSSVAMGTFGFMAPEQTRNLQLTTASDLYGLGLTLVCVIAQLKSHEIGEYVDWSNQLDQKAIEAKIKGCSFRFIEWLNQMVAPDPKKRFPDAATALEALKPLYVKRTPEVKLSCTTLNFEATKVGEKLSQTITISNSIPETILEGYWEVAPHPNDPPHTPDRHPWIAVSPKAVQGNEVTCKITIDTSQLQTEQQGSRKLMFYSNTNLDKTTIQIQVKTAHNLAPLPQFFYLWEFLYFAIMLLNGVVLTLGIMHDLLEGEITGSTLIFWGLSLTMIAIFSVFFNHNYKYFISKDQSDDWVRSLNRFFSVLLCSGGIGTGLTLGFTTHLLIPLAALGGGTSFIYVSMLPMLTRRRQLAAQRRREHYLIEP